MRYAAIVSLVLLAVGCATCEPDVIRVPYEVEVMVPTPPQPLELPPPPLIESCTPADTTLTCLQKIGRNVKRLEAYAAALRVEIEAHNAAAGGDDGSGEPCPTGLGVLADPPDSGGAGVPADPPCR